MNAPVIPKQIEYWPLAQLKPYARNAKTHDAGQVAKIAASMAEFGWTMPVLVAADGELIAGHDRILAAAHLGLAEVPVIVLGRTCFLPMRASSFSANALYRRRVGLVALRGEQKMLVFQKSALVLSTIWEKAAAFSIILLLTAPAALADELRDLVSSGIHKDIFLAEQSISERVANEDNTCFANISFNKPKQVGALGIVWNGKCEGKLAHGSGTLTLLFDSIPIFSETFDTKRGSAMIDGVPMSTLRSNQFVVLQSTCKQAGIIYDNTKQMNVAEYPSFAAVNSWTVEQDVWLYQNNTEAWCDGRFSRDTVIAKSGDVVAVADSVLTNLDRYFQIRQINIFEFNNRYNEGIQNYNTEIAERNAKVELDQKAARLAKSSALKAKMEGDDYVITNMADFLELMGPIKGVAALAKGRKVVAGISNISFSNGHFVSRFTAKSSSSIDAQNDLEENFSWDGFLGAALDGGMMAGTVEVACSFDPNVDTDMMVGSSIVVDATLLSLEGGFISLACVPR